MHGCPVDVLLLSYTPRDNGYNSESDPAPVREISGEMCPALLLVTSAAAKNVMTNESQGHMICWQSLLSMNEASSSH
ncbi:hypothetical protein TNCT_115241 [Trichonephila clavata]|uniref:Uncharacterized protein n=1 Tax=Trichonephila clavata TaxID=2740835 RepID=A0A8X6HPA3_TRICU|nr:hypothetical protein TNCT_115241 [Trichonephila clavata]